MPYKIHMLLTTLLANRLEIILEASKMQLSLKQRILCKGKGSKNFLAKSLSQNKKLYLQKNQ